MSGPDRNQNPSRIPEIFTLMAGISYIIAAYYAIKANGTGSQYLMQALVSLFVVIIIHAVFGTSSLIRMYIQRETVSLKSRVWMPAYYGVAVGLAFLYFKFAK